MKNLTILTAILIILSCSSDDGPVDQESLLPPITTTGENTFGCLIDGKFFKPRDGRITVNSDNRGLSTVRTEDVNWEIAAYDRKSTKTVSLIIHIENLFQNNQGIEGIYNLGQANGMRGLDGPDINYMYCTKWNQKSGDYEVYYSSVDNGAVEFLRLENGQPGTYSIHAGVFQATLHNVRNIQDSIFAYPFSVHLL
jgi:hypothetical protein